MINHLVVFMVNVMVGVVIGHAWGSRSTRKSVAWELRRRAHTMSVESNIALKEIANAIHSV